MKTLSSMHSPRRASAQMGIGVLAIAAIVLLFATPLFSYGASTTVSVSAGTTPYNIGDTIKISGTVSPATTTLSVAVSISNPNGVQVDISPVNVNQTSGAFSYSKVSGGTANWINGTYTVTAKFSDSFGANYQASATFRMGAAAVTTTSSSFSGTTTTVQINRTITTVQQTTTTVVQQTTVTQVQQTTVTQAQQTTVTQVQQTTVTQQSTLTQQNTVHEQTTVTESYTNVDTTTPLAVGAVGLVVGIVAALIAVMALRKK